MTRRRDAWSPAGMANVLSDEKKQQVLALGRLGWSLRKIEEAAGVKRETAGAYLRAASIAVRAPRQVVLLPPFESDASRPARARYSALVREEPCALADDYQTVSNFTRRDPARAAT